MRLPLRMASFRQYCLLILLLLGSLPAFAQRSDLAPLREAFAGSDILDEELRGKILHHLEQDSASQTLELDLGVKLLAFSPTQLSLQTSAVGRWDLRLLPLLGGNSLSAVIETVLAPQTDARLSLFDRDWRPLQSPSPLLLLPQASDFLTPLHLPASSASSRLQELLYPLHYEMQWANEGDATLLIRPALLLSEEDQRSPELLRLIASLPTLTYRWTGASFVRQPSAK